MSKEKEQSLGPLVKKPSELHKPPTHALIFLERISTASGAKVSFDVTCDCVFGAA